MHHIISVNRKIAFQFLISGAILLVICTCRATPIPPEPPLPGALAPEFSLNAVREDQEIRLNDLRGQAVLIAFLNTQAQDGQDPSNNQLVFLRSMQKQFGERGMLTLVVDASWLVTGQPTILDDLINYSYDHQLDTIPVLMAQDVERIIDSYGISQLPTTLLVDGSGIIRQRWNGYASASQLSLALEAEVGPPVYRQEGVTFPSTSSHKICENETPAQAQFAGLGLARRLSDTIWLVDGGQQWKANREFPLQWLVIDRNDVAQEQEIQLQVTATNLQSGRKALIVDQVMEPLPPDEAAALFAGGPDAPLTKYLLATAVQLDGASCYKLEAMVTDLGEHNLLYQGYSFVSAK